MTAGTPPAGAPTDRPLGIAGRIGVLLMAAAGVAFAASGDFGILLYTPYVVVGAVLTIRRPRNPIGWLLILMAWCFNLTSWSIPTDPITLANGTASPLAYALVWLSGWSGNLLFWCFLLLMIIFPTGRLPSGRWRGPAVAALATSGLIVIMSALAPTFDVSTGDSSALVTVANPLAILPDSPFWGPAADYGFVVLFGLLIAGVVSMLVRWRRSSGVEAQQLRWVVFSLAAVTTGVLIGLVGVIVTGNDNAITWYAALLAFPLPPIAVGIAILRYRLYEIDRIVSRTIGWAMITGILAVAYVGAILGLGALLAPFANSNTIAVAASTLAIAALFNPVRRRVQSVVDRRFNRAKIDSDAVASAFAGRLRDEVDLDALSTDLRSTIAVAVEPTSSAIWIRSGGGSQPGIS